jgi:hypothetical protein
VGRPAGERVIAGFMAQTGDGQKGDGIGGSKYANLAGVELADDRDLEAPQARGSRYRDWTARVGDFGVARVWRQDFWRACPPLAQLRRRAVDSTSSCPVYVAHHLTASLAVDGPVDHVGNALCVVHMSTGLGAERF